MKRKLPNWLDGWMTYMKRRESPLLYKKWVGVFTLCSCLQRKCWIEWDKYVFPNMYVLLVGPAACRKGTAMSPAINLLRRLNINFAADSVTRQALIETLDESQVEAPFLPPEMNTEGMMSCLTIFSEEFSAFLGTNNLDFVNQLTDWYDCGAAKGYWEYRTKGCGVNRVLGPWVNLLGGITPEMVAPCIPREAVGGGFASRFMLVYGSRKSVINPYPVPTEEERTLFSLLEEDLAHVLALQGPFTPTEEFIEKNAEWYIHTENNPTLEDPKFDAYYGRRVTHLLKLCMALSAARDDKMIIDEEIRQQAMGMLEKTERVMPYVYSGHGRNKWVEMVPYVISSLARTKSVPFKALLTKFSKDLTAFELQQIIFALRDQGAVALSKGDLGETVITYTRDLPVKDNIEEAENACNQN